MSQTPSSIPKPERRTASATVDVAALRRELELRGWSQADLAAKADISPTTLSGIMHSGKAVSLRVVKKIARALDAEAVTPTMAVLLSGRAA
jgi:transcriptional regulator with XRE-family HTH domain